MTNTYEFPGKEDVEIIVGDEKQPDFYPRMKIKRWDNEVNFSIGIISTFQGSHNKGSHNKVGDIVEWNDGHGVGAKFYQKPGDQFEFEISLDERPLTGFVLLSIDTKGLDFFYQPPLTREEIDDGCERTDNVVRSYAVYHKTMKGNFIGGKNYRNGKFCHIYRPYATDAKGKHEWCDMNITGSVMKITVPDGLVYPVVIDPTFGYTSVGETSLIMGSYNIIYSSGFSMPEDGTLTNITGYNSTNTTPPGSDFSLAIYDASNRIDYTTPEQTDDVAADWHSFSVVVGASLSSGTTYFIAFVYGNGSSSTDMKLYYDSLGHYPEYEYIDYSYPPPATWSPSTSSSDRTLSIYATYTAGTPPSGTARARIFTGPLGGPFGGPI